MGTDVPRMARWRAGWLCPRRRTAGWMRPPPPASHSQRPRRRRECRRPGSGAGEHRGCFCGLRLIYSNKSCTMPPITFQDLPLNIYMVIFGTGIFVFVLSLIFCCYFISTHVPFAWRISRLKKNWGCYHVNMLSTGSAW
ncbi:RING finger protein 122 isoform X3 [Mobula birostris]|uniref:RING finger protein 122 isoform X3 n=1 Tax=Mobula birostris TaxID=1983395 RepID=UPI003B281AE2